MKITLSDIVVVILIIIAEFKLKLGDPTFFFIFLLVGLVGGWGNSIPT